MSGLWSLPNTVSKKENFTLVKNANTRRNGCSWLSWIYWTLEDEPKEDLDPRDETEQESEMEVVAGALGHEESNAIEARGTCKQTGAAKTREKLDRELKVHVY